MKPQEISWMALVRCLIRPQQLLKESILMAPKMQLINLPKVQENGLDKSGMLLEILSIKLIWMELWKVLVSI